MESEKLTKEGWKEAEGRWRGERGAVMNTEQHDNSLVKRYDFANLFSSSSFVLDLGCGSGYGTEILSKKNWRVHGIDKSEDAINFAKRHYDKGNIEWSVESFPPILKKEKTYDIVVCHEVIEHMADDNALVAEIERILTPRGMLLMTTPVASEKPPAKWHFREYTREQFRAILSKHFSEVFIMDFDHEKHMAVCKK